MAEVRRAGAWIGRRVGAWRKDQDPIRQIAGVGLFDLEYYLAQLADSADAPRDLAAALEFHIASGRDLGLSFHPLVEPEWWGAAASADLMQAEEAFARGQVRGASTSPLVADTTGPIGASITALKDVLAGRRAVGLPEGWDVPRLREGMIAEVRRMTADSPNDGRRSGVDWRALVDELPARVPGRVSILVPTYQDWRMTVDAVRAALSTAGDADAEVVVVDNGSRRAVSRLLTAVFLTEPRVRVIRASVNTNFAGGMNIALAASTGEYVLLLNNDAILRDGWLPLLSSPLADSPQVRGTQPLLVYPGTGRIQAAGTMFLGEGVLPWHFLAGHPVADAERITDTRFAAVTAAVMMLRAADLVRAHGFDESYANGYEDVDLCLRLRGSDADHFVVVPGARAEHPEGSSPGRSAHDTANRAIFLERWRGAMPAPEPGRYRELGMALVGLRPIAHFDEARITLAEPQLIRRRALVADGPGAGLPRLRWALVIPPGGGDDHAPLAEATRLILEHFGQEVVGPVVGLHWSDALDDVVVAIGAGVCDAPRSGAFNVQVGEPGAEPTGWDLQTAAITETDVPALVRRAAQARETRFDA